MMDLTPKLLSPTDLECIARNHAACGVPDPDVERLLCHILALNSSGQRIEAAVREMLRVANELRIVDRQIEAGSALVYIRKVCEQLLAPYDPVGGRKT